MIRVERETLKALLAGEVVQLRKKCLSARGFHAGESYSFAVDGKPSPYRLLVVSSKRKLRLGKVTRGHRLSVVLDRQRPVRYLALRPGHGEMDEVGNRDYTENPSAGVRERFAGALDADEQAKITEMARRRSQTQLETERTRREKHSLEQRLSIARKVAEVKGIDIAMKERALERQILDLERLLEDRITQAALFRPQLWARIPGELSQGALKSATRTLQIAPSLIR